MKRLALALAFAALAAAACQRAQQETPAADTTQMSDTTKMMTDSAPMAGDTAKRM